MPHDVFVSYAHSDDERPQGAEFGWVTTFKEELAKVGVIFMPYWLTGKGEGPGLDAIWRTMSTVREWTGSWEHVAIGTDFDGFTYPPDDCDSSSKLPRVRELLEAKRLSAAEVEAVLGGNARRVLRTAWRWPSATRIWRPCSASQRLVRSARSPPPSRHIRPNGSWPLSTAARTTR